MASPDSFQLLQRLEAGDDRAPAEVFDRYIDRLRALVRDRIGTKLGRRVDADDILQSTYRSFFTKAKQGDYALTKSCDLWRLLASIALHKLYGQVERHTAARRSTNLETNDTTGALRAPAPKPNIVEAIAVAEQLDRIARRLSHDQRTALVAYLQGHSPEDIAHQLGKSLRTVRRLLAESREELERELLNRTPLTARKTPPLSAASAALIKFEYADFVLERLVGAGGMGKVYRAKNRHTGDRVAIKTLPKTRRHDERVIDMFLQEAEILSKLDRPNIVKFHGVGRFPGGSYFLVMDFIDGSDLQRRIEHEPLQTDEAIQVIRSVAQAVGYAHSQGIIHGDLKPANVVLNASHQPIVTDFGLAQFIDPGRIDAPQSVGGTTGYIAPEVRSGKQRPTVVADVFALGALLVALITGRPPVSDSVTIEPQGLETICSRSLSIDSADRYQSIVTFLTALGVD